MGAMNMERADAEKRKKQMSDDIYRFIRDHAGKENAVPSRNLEDRYDIGGRDVRRCVSSLRKDGVPICSCCKGYYFAGSQEDINETVGWLNAHLSGVSNARTALLFASANEVARLKLKMPDGRDQEFLLIPASGREVSI